MPIVCIFLNTPAAGAVGGVCALGLLLLLLAIIGVAIAKCYRARQKKCETNNECEGVCA